MQVRLGRLSALIPLTLAMAIVGATATAGAQDAAPTPCDGKFAISDPKGDALYSAEHPIHPLGEEDAPASVDLRGAFYTFTDDTLRANIVVENLSSKAVVGGAYADSIAWNARFVMPDGHIYIARAYLKAGAFRYALLSYTYPFEGTPADAQLGDSGFNGTETAVKGRVFEGPMGVIQIDLTGTTAKPKVGDKLTGLTTASYITSKANGEFLYNNDSAGDRATSNTTVPACASAAATTPAESPTPAPEGSPTPEPQSSPTPAPQSSPTPAPQSSPTPAPQGQTPAAQPAPKKSTAKKKKKAKKCKKARGKAKGHTKKGFAKCPKPKKKKAARR